MNIGLAQRRTAFIVNPLTTRHTAQACIVAGHPEAPFAVFTETGNDVTTLVFKAVGGVTQIVHTIIEGACPETALVIAHQ